MKPIPLERILQSQGLGSRKQCRSLIEEGLVEVNHQLCLEPSALFSPHAIHLNIDRKEWPYRECVYLMLHKPAGYECSRSAQHHASVFSLLPEAFTRRNVQPVGRLDEDTTGLLLLTDQGQWSHRLTSPRHHVGKGYRVHTRHAVTPLLVQQLLDGVLLKDHPVPVKAIACQQSGTHQLDLTISEGQYHQVKRMIAAGGNRVEQLHRFRIGGVYLPEDLKPGEWRDLRADELQLLTIG